MTCVSYCVAHGTVRKAGIWRQRDPAKIGIHALHCFFNRREDAVGTSTRCAHLLPNGPGARKHDLCSLYGVRGGLDARFLR